MDILWWLVGTLLAAGWNLGKWLDQMHQVWISIGGWSGAVTRIGLLMMAWVVFWVFVLWWNEDKFSDGTEPKDAAKQPDPQSENIVELAPIQEPVEEQPTIPLELAQISIPTTPLKARIGRISVNDAIDAAIVELNLLEEEQEKRGEM